MDDEAGADYSQISSFDNLLMLEFNEYMQSGISGKNRMDIDGGQLSNFKHAEHIVSTLLEECMETTVGDMKAKITAQDQKTNALSGEIDDLNAQID